MMIFYVWNVSKTVEISGEILELKKQEQILDNRLNVLQSKIIELRSADRICTIAEEKLEMIKPEKAPKTIEYE
jgi:cell division protein FtsL